MSKIILVALLTYIGDNIYVLFMKLLTKNFKLRKKVGVEIGGGVRRVSTKTVIFSKKKVHVKFVYFHNHPDDNTNACTFIVPGKCNS